VARAEHRVAVAALRAATELAEQISSDLAAVATRHEGDGSAVEDARQKLSDLHAKLEETVSSSLASAQDALARRQRSLGRFTVTLFGRTMAGKSTIREALSRGDGSTIGKGAQRTTRDIREYDWNSLRIIDTPGIGAYEGGTDRDIALSVVDQSDVILFLVSSDGIQEEVFRGMQALRSQNKPVIFVLNVKQDLEKAVYLRRFLRDASTVFNEQELNGHFSRLRRLAIEFLDMWDIRAVPIHAQAAFLATRPEHVENAPALLERSRIDSLLTEVQDEVLHRGTVRRLQTILDGALIALTDLQEQLREQAKTIRGRATYLRDKFRELDTWLDGFVRAMNCRVEAEAAQLFQPLRSGVSVFIDENIERSDVAKRWQKRVDELGIGAWLQGQQDTILAELRGRLTEFAREMAVESKLVTAFQTTGPRAYDPWDIKRTMRWVSAGCAVLAGVAAVAGLFGAANFWNPVGWVASAVSVIAFGFSWLFTDRERTLQREKGNAAAQLRAHIDALEQRVGSSLKRWFDEQVSGRLVTGIRDDTRRLYDGMSAIAHTLDNRSCQVAELVENLTRRLLTRTGSLLGTRVKQSTVRRVVRDPGVRSKLLWKGRKEYAEFCETVGQAIGECVDGVPSGPPQAEVAGALKPASVIPNMVTLVNGEAKVRLPSAQADLAIGKGGGNVSLASRLVQRRITILGQGQDDA
jgi:hypothetical protein